MASSQVELVTLPTARTAYNSDADARSDLADFEARVDSTTEHEQVSLPPVDRGKDAYLFLAAAFVVEALVWGFPFSFGVFQDYYSTHPPFEGQSNIAAIGTCALGIMYLDLPIIFAAIQRWPRCRQYLTPVGLLIICLAMGLSSFSTTTTHLMVTQGVVYAVGGSMAYAPLIGYVDEWFVERKGRAFGVMWAGTALSGVIIPLVMQHVLSTYGHRTTLRIWSITLFILIAPLLYFIKPRLPLPISSSSTTRPVDFSFLKTRIFTLYQICNTIEALGFFLPAIYMPSYARTLGATPVLSALTVVLNSLAATIGCLLMGAVVDRWHVTSCLALSTFGAVVSVFCLWGTTTGLKSLYAFAVVYGLSAGSYTTCWPGIMRDVSRKKVGAEPGLVFAALAAGRGLGNVVSGPLSEAFVKITRGAGEWSARGGYGTEYGPLIVFTGVTALFGGTTILGRRLGWV